MSTRDSGRGDLHEAERHRAGVDVVDLCIATDGGDTIVDGVSMSIAAGEVAGLIGESGSGKTAVAHALLGYARPGLRILSGRVEVAGADILALPARTVHGLRGQKIAYVPQDSASSLDPLMAIGSQMAEVKKRLERAGQTCRLEETLELVGLPTEPSFYRRRPHQISGGQQQRLLLAIAFMGSPDLVVLDEPTTALDVMTQDMVLGALRRLLEATRPAVLYVSHDLALLNQIADSLTVMYAGRVMEHGTRSEIVTAARHPYTQGLVGAVPRIDSSTLPRGISTAVLRAYRRRGEEGEGGSGRDAVVDRSLLDTPAERRQDPTELAVAPAVRAEGPVGSGSGARVAVDGLTIQYGRHTVIDDMSFELPRTGCTALVGESGSGKSSISRTLAGLQTASGGTLRIDGTVLDLAEQRRTRRQLRRIQYVFQNPAGALNPRKHLLQTLRDALVAFEPDLSPHALIQRVKDALEQVALPTAYLLKYPGQLSGGEKQRVGIARALITQPDIIVCDEVTSALDVSVQASIAQLLRDLCDSGAFAMIFVTHNLALVRSLADEVIVLQHGRIAEHGTTQHVFESSTDPYTHVLLEKTPTLPVLRDAG